MWFRIATHALHCTVLEAQERLTSLEFTEYCAYYSMEPFGFDIENYRSGVIAATVANVAPRKKGTKPLKAIDFYPTGKKKPNELTPRQQREMDERRAKRKKG